jgi:hypothetical protein
VKRSLSTKERNRMFEELQRSNNILRTLFSRPVIPGQERNPLVRAFIARYNQNDCDAVRTHASDVKKALDACWQCSCSHRISLDLNWHINRPTRSPVFSVSVSYDVGTNQGSTRSPQWQKAQAQIDATGLSSSSSTPENDQQVLGLPITDTAPTVTPRQSPKTKQKANSLLSWLRLRSHSTSPRPSSPSNSVAPVSLAVSVKRIDSLCRFIQESGNGGESLGFLTVPGGTQHVHFTSIPGAGKEEVTLVHLLPPKKPLAHLILSRHKRFEIAVAAAWTTLLLCETPWLDHTWDKHELCFLLENVTPAGHTLEGRCVSMTQDCTSSPQLTNTTGAFLQNRAIRNEAAFALGVLLIELGLNRSFEECKRTTTIGTTATNAVDNFIVAESLIDEVFAEAGGLYGNAVQTCIRFAFPGRDMTKNFSDATFRQYFHNLVVAPIEATLSSTLI